jgi:mannose-6-phosphate isomerase-like protein (cupin superfamily)
MTDEIVLEGPGFRGRIAGMFGEMLIIDADLEGEIDSHCATSDELAVVISGHIRVTMDGVIAHYGPGDHLVVPCGAKHAIVAEKPSRLILVGKA